VNTFDVGLGEVGLGEVLLATVQEVKLLCLEVMPRSRRKYVLRSIIIRGKDWTENDAWMEGRLLPRCTTWRRRGVLNKGRGKAEALQAQASSSRSKIARLAASCGAKPLIDQVA
jgi:hypothetical protein